MTQLRQSWPVLLLLLLLSPLLASTQSDAKEAAAHDGDVNAISIASLTLDQFHYQLQSCDIMQRLSAQKVASGAPKDAATDNLPPIHANRLTRLLFPWSSPAANALLATLYISGPPNILLAVLPSSAAANPAALQTMVAFAVGGLLGDTLLHLLPEVFIGEDDPDRARVVLVEPRRNLLLGAAILVGFVVFVAIDKAMRIGSAGAEPHHHHGHDATPVIAKNNTKAGKGTSTAIGIDSNPADRSVSRRKVADSVTASPGREASHVGAPAESKKTIRLSAYLNLIADFTHNITDGLAMSASFYASPTIGATTAIAVFFHEIPHEVGDFALLVQSGFSRRAAVAAQFVTALGALLGTVIGISVQELGGGARDAMGMTGGILGTSLTWGDMLLPFTAGTFLYVGTVAVIPELLETGPNRLAELRKTLVQFLALAAGAGIMFLISW